MAEHCCHVHRVLGNQDTNWEWDFIQSQGLEYMGLSQYDFEGLYHQIQEMGLGNGIYYC